MTKQELKVIDHLAKAMNKFEELPVMHSDDFDEFFRAIHAAQNIVMAREAVRAYPEVFVNETLGN